MAKRISDEVLKQLWLELGNTTEIAKRIGYSRTGTHLALKRIGVRSRHHQRYLDEELGQFLADGKELLKTATPEQRQVIRQTMKEVVA